jgi:PPOX class probable F420-dependent enzyme
MPIDPGVRALFAGANFVHLATLTSDGSPHSVAIWADALDDDHVVFFTNRGSQKAKNIERDPRLAMSLVDRDDPYRTGMLRGRVVRTIDGDDARPIVDRISHKYTGRPFPYPGSTVYVVAAHRSRLISLSDSFDDTPAA